VQKKLDIPFAKFNLHGGAIAIGHSLGASGAESPRISPTPCISWARSTPSARRALSGGQGIAVVLKSLA